MDDAKKEQYRAELNAAIEAAWEKFKTDEPETVQDHCEWCTHRFFAIAFLEGSIWEGQRKLTKNKKRQNEVLREMAETDQKIAEIRDHLEEE